ncbi:putative RNA-binding C25G10.01 [Gossypium arboreum]|uniref:Putative RNA-binding C25G10.01 n=1 Tax=Gossypium arboreum TaxID=29729 RepID=A0A0B0PAI4_GOSAR|nr:putative RNA-binding C25G10.01 [Gossypium arboreum]
MHDASRRKRPRTPTPGHYLGLKNTRDYGIVVVVVMTTGIVDLPGAHHIEVVITLQGILLMVEDQGGSALIHHHILADLGEEVFWVEGER